MYINDLAMASKKITPITYTGDATLLSTPDNITSSHTTNSISNKINTELTKITDWLAVNKLSVNANKTKMMIFNSKKLKTNEIRNIEVNRMAIEHVTHFKSPVVLIDSNLTWHSHINYIANKLSRICGIISRLKHCVSVHPENNLQFFL